MSIITLTTDYGTKDHFVGALKGKILSEYPESVIVDLSHEVDPFNISEAAYIIGAAYNSFPKGTVHIIGIDCELSKENVHVAMQWNDHFFICADNGILSILIQKFIPQKMVTISIHDRLPVEATDMDVFIKVACHLAKGGALSVIGKDISSLREITELKPSLSANEIKGNVIYIDHYGNVVTNIDKKTFLEIGKNRPYAIRFKGKIIKTILPKYVDIATDEKYPVKYYEGEKLAIFNEAGFLEIAVFRSNPSTSGSASSLLGLDYRDAVTVTFETN